MSEDHLQPTSLNGQQDDNLEVINERLLREAEAHQATQNALLERTKELKCLLGLSRLLDQGGAIEDLLARTVHLLPPAFQFPEIAVARIRFRDKVFQTGDMEECGQSLKLGLKGQKATDCLEVGYLDKQPFLPEESLLLEIVAERLGVLIEGFEAHEAERLSERRLRLLTENSLDTIWALNMQLEVTYVNSAKTALTGYTVDEYIGTHLGQHFSETEMEAVQSAIDEALAAGKDHPFTIREFTCLDRQGNEIPVEVHAKVLFDERGNPQGFQGTSRDIRERRRTLVALQESEEKHRTLFENMAQGVIFQNRLGEITSANPAAERILGLSADELKGRNSDDDCWRAIREDGTKYPAGEHPSMIALRTGREARNGIMGVFNPKDGEYRWLKVSAAPQFRLGEDTPFQVFSTFEDVTELRRLDAQRRAANLFSAELLESIRDGFFALDWELQVTYLNGAAEEFLGKTREQLVGNKLFDLFPELRETIIEENYRRALAERVKLEFESFDESHDRWYETQVYPSANGISVFFRNVTERKNAEKERQEIESQLRQALKMEAVGRLAGGLAHDFNNMLSVILGHSELALTSLAPEDPLHEELTEIVRAGQRSASLTRQLLAFARKQTISPRTLDINAAVSGTLRMLKRLIGEDIDLIWNPSSENLSVKMDPSQLDQVLTNLVVNARDALEGVGSIVIETSSMQVEQEFSRHHHGLLPGAYVKLAVTDTGTGIDETILPKIFEPFFTTKPEGRGTGLGLAMVHGVIQQNGGTVDISSELGKGSTFELYLPAVFDQAKSGVPSESGINTCQGRETVLVVEDEPSLLRLTARMLQGLGYKVMTAGSPQDALKLYQSEAHTLDLLLTDVVMPEMNGAHLSERLKAVHPELKCLFMSGYTSEAIGERGGVLDSEVHFLQKPFTRDELARKTREALA